MEMNDIEMMKVFDFLIENKELIISDKGLFSFDTLKKVRNIMKHKGSNCFELTEEQKQLIIDTFINSNQVFNEDTLDFLLSNESCIKASISRDINSINYLLFLPPSLEEYIIERAKKEHFILKEDSPDCVRTCFEIALHSIQLDVNSANFILWECIPEEKRNILVDQLIRNGYILSQNSPDFLMENKKVVFRSIQKDLDSFCYADSSMKKNFMIVKYLISHGYEFRDSEIRRFPLDFFVDAEFMRCCLRSIDIANSTDERYMKCVSELYSDALKRVPSIDSFQSVFETSAEFSWKEYRERHSNDYNNIFGIICGELEEHDDFKGACSELEFLGIMEDILGKEKYRILSEAMEEYFLISHSETDNQLARIQKSKDIIAELSALYVSKAKEDYKKEELKEYYEWIHPYFTLRINHPMIQKKLILAKQKEKFEYLYSKNDKDTNEFLESLIQKYSKFLNSESINNMIYDFIVYRDKTLDEIDVPDYYSDFVKMEKATKLIRRLNSKFIEYDGVEMINYRDIISYDESRKEYIYSGKVFEQQDIIQFDKYKKKLDIFEKIKREIISKVREIEVDNQIDEGLLEELVEELPFTDEYFTFNSEKIGNFNFKYLLEDACLDSDFQVNNFKSPSIYSNIYHLLVDQGMIWLLLFMGARRKGDLADTGVTPEGIRGLINNMDEITDLSRQFHFDLTNFQELVLLKEISRCANPVSLAILGDEVISKISKYRSYTRNKTKVVISMATELAAQMVKRDKSTVPYIQGETANYKYSLYDSQDETLLLAGIHTNACFRVDGNDNDFLHYCALDKNGFVIKITNYSGDFIGRASGFRNGNCIFINQLRTIYDKGGTGYLGRYSSEQDDIIETFKRACEDIVTISGQNSQEIDKIEYVFVTKSYSLRCYPSNVSYDVEYEIGSEPMDNISEDWEHFKENTKNLQENYEEEDYFTTDYSGYDLICMASIKNPEEIMPEDIKPKNVDALYERERTPIIVTNQVDNTIIRKINKIRGIYFYFKGMEFEPIEIPNQSVILIGDNWYIVYHNGEIIDFRVLEFDREAKIEFKAASIILEENGIYYLDIDKVKDNIQINTEEEDNEKVKNLTPFH